MSLLFRQRFAMHLNFLVKPNSVAIVGATERPGPGRQLIESLHTIGFTGVIYPVNPKYTTVLDHLCYPTLTELPEAADVVVFCIRNQLIPEQMKTAIQRGVRAAVIYDGGFAELGTEGARLQEEIAGMCREAGMALCGPNCMGIINPTARVTTYRQKVLNSDGLAGNVGLVSQSGSVCIAMLSDLRRFGFSLCVSAGNEAVTRTVDYLEYMVDDPATKIIATFMETVREPARYVAALDRAAAVGKPVIVLKVGRSERTQRAITSHTGGLAGESRVFSEVLRAHRAIEVNDLDEMTEVLAVCQGQRWPRGRGISVITGSGGLAEMILDSATTAGIHLPPLSPEERVKAERVIGPVTGDGNPFDSWGNGNYAVNVPYALSIAEESEQIHSIVYCFDVIDESHLGNPARITENVSMLAKAFQSSNKPYYMMSSRQGLMSEQQAKALRERGMVQICGTLQGLGALDRVGRYMMQPRPFRVPAAPPAWRLREELPSQGVQRTMNEFDAKRLLKAYGLPIARERRVENFTEAQSAAKELGYPVVLKVVSDEIPHKTELGLVIISLNDDEELASAFEELSQRVGRINARLSDGAYLVQEFVRGGVEVFAGVSRDPDFGLVLAFGMGGTAIEVSRDFTLRMLPLRDGDAEAMIAETRGAAMLGPVRGGPPADVKAVAACLTALAEFAGQNSDVLEEVDLNPIKVLPEGKGCVVVDALIVAKSQRQE
jgi:acyl-CoA synthetase (NDP forming)